MWLNNLNPLGDLISLPELLQVIVPRVSKSETDEASGICDRGFEKKECQTSNPMLFLRPIHIGYVIVREAPKRKQEALDIAL